MTKDAAQRRSWTFYEAVTFEGTHSCTIRSVSWEVEGFTAPDPNSRNCKLRVDDSGKRKFIAVLRQKPVDSPEMAVKAFIVSEYKKERKGELT